jgi:hypothetical protein
MSDEKRRETKPDLQKGKQTTIAPPKGETAVDRRPYEKAVDRQPYERKG